MRKLILLLIGFIAVATFIRAFDNNEAMNHVSQQAVIEASLNN